MVETGETDSTFYRFIFLVDEFTTVGRFQSRFDVDFDAILTVNYQSFGLSGTILGQKELLLPEIMILTRM